ncbi:O-antigen polymerase [Halorubrum sodomense]|uniref:Oligosaccharide repeat unit polymerase n=1 Tax=Halorubrum sodomense TaxID=35743 RepID=A0A1I6FX10_HALSD|nr:O-antigen polymerase [Halorubrum sodomense]SFR34502.1 oligosaccharide repeat unit polymerase [Halorubrum sodomense]
MNFKFVSRRDIIHPVLIVTLLIIPLGLLTSEIFSASIERATLSVVFFSLSLVFLLLSYNRYHDYFSPLGLMGLTWLLSISLSVTKLSPAFQTNWELDTWLIIFISLFSFIIGCLLAGNITKDRTGSVSFNSEALKIIILGTFLISYSSFIIIFIYTIGTNSISADVLTISWYKQVQREFWIFGLGYLYNLNFLLPVLCVGHVYRYGRDRLVTAILVISLTAWPFNILAVSHLLLPIFAIFIVINMMGSSTIRFSTSLIFGLVMLAVFVIMDVIYGSRIETFVSLGLVQFPDYLSALAMPYLYASTSFDNLQVILNTDIQHYYGSLTLEPFLKFTLLQDLLGIHPQEPTIMYGERFNANTYLATVYYDFGLLGPIVVPCVFGLISTHIYNFSRKYKSVPSITAYSVVAFPVTFAFFGDFFTSSFVLSLIIYCLFLHFIQLWLVASLSENPI